MEVSLGPFDSASAACDYCFSSFTKEGNPPAGPVAPFCVCMAYNEGGCRCKAKDMQAMGKTTCQRIA